MVCTQSGPSYKNWFWDRFLDNLRIRSGFKCAVMDPLVIGLGGSKFNWVRFGTGSNWIQLHRGFKILTRPEWGPSRHGESGSLLGRLGPIFILFFLLSEGGERRREGWKRRRSRRREIKGGGKWVWDLVDDFSWKTHQNPRSEIPSLSSFRHWEEEEEEEEEMWTNKGDTSTPRTTRVRQATGRVGRAWFTS